MERRPAGNRLAPWLVLAACAVPAAAGGAVPVALYPVQSEGLKEGERAEVQSVVESALRGAGRRGVLEPRSPLVLPATCRPPVAAACLAAQAKGGAVLFARAKRRGGQLLVTVLLVDSAGRRTRAAAFPVDLFIQNLRPALDAIATVEGALASGDLEDAGPPPAAARPPVPERPLAPERASPPPAERSADVAPEPPAPPPAVAAAPAPPPVPTEPPRAAPPPAPEPAPIPPTPSPPTPSPQARRARDVELPPPPVLQPQRPSALARSLEPKAPAPKADAGEWRRTAGLWCTVGGAALLAGGATAGLLGRRLSDDLTDRARAGTLVPADAAKYDLVDRYALVANVLFAAGGVATVAGVTFFAGAPAGGGGSVAIAGSF